MEEYSAGVKKRIDKLTKKMREAERSREEAAIEYAKTVKTESDKLKSSNHDLLKMECFMLVDRRKKIMLKKSLLNELCKPLSMKEIRKNKCEAQQAISKIGN